MTNARERILAKLGSNFQDRPAIKDAFTSHKNVTEKWQDRFIESETECIEHFCQQLITNKIELIRTAKDSWQEHLGKLAGQRKLEHWLLGTGLHYQEQASKALDNSSRVKSVTRYDSNYEELKNDLFNKFDASLTIAQAGIAETGSLLVIPNDNEPRTMSLVPAVHIILLRASQIVPTLQDFISDYSDQIAEATNTLVISSPSKTADIQQTLAYGAHGPKELIVILDEES